MRASMFGAILAIALAMPATPVRAEGALAIGLPDGDPGNGFVYGISSDKLNGQAGADALQTCRGVNVRDTSRARASCRIVEIFYDECANVAVNGDRNTPSTAVGWAFGPDSRTANNRAIAQCEVMRRGRGRTCHLDGNALCDGRAN